MIALTILSLLLAAFYFYFTRTFDYWTKRGVKHDKPIPLFGTNARGFLLRANHLDILREQYKKYPNERLVGFFRGSSPELIVRDPELARCVLISDFNSFHRRGVEDQTELEPLQRHLGAADDDLWRQLRLRLTPAFSSGKLKGMFPLIQQCAESLETKVQTITVGQRPADAKDLMARYTNDVIASVGFGIVSDALNNDDDLMRQLGIKIVSADLKRSIIFTLKSAMPELFRPLKLFGNVEQDLISMVREVMQQRNYEPSGRKDFIDILLECKKQGAMTGDSIVEVNDDGTPKKVSIEMDDIIMAAQCGLFFVAGFDATSSVSAYTLHELAHNPQIQIKAQKEIDTVLAKYENRLCYDAVMEMSYLKWCLNEAMRMFPSLGRVQRISVHPYTFPGTKVTIDAGTYVIIPLDVYQNDPEIFPEPKKFRPERFDPDVMMPIQKLSFLPFGNGPRTCLGNRLAMVMMQAGVATLLSRFSVRPVPGTPRYPTSGVTSGQFNKAKELPLIFEERKG